MTDHFVEQALWALNPGRLNSDPLTVLRNGLVNRNKEHRGGKEQRDFLNAVHDNCLLEYLESQGVSLDFDQLSEKTLRSVLPNRMQESEYVRAPVSSVQAVRNCYLGLSQEAASNVAVWNAITLNNIRMERLDASYLAVPTRARHNVSGRFHIRKAFEAQNSSKEIDDRVRDVFRRMGGLHGVRGNVSVISNCTLSRYWWMGHFTEKAVEEFDLNVCDVRDVLNPRWGELMEWAIERLVIISIHGLMLGLIGHLLEIPVPNNNEFKSLLRRIGQEFSTVDLHAWSASEVRDHLRELRNRAA